MRVIFTIPTRLWYFFALQQIHVLLRKKFRHDVITTIVNVLFCLQFFFLKPWSKIQMPSFNIFVFLVFFQKSDKTLKFSATLASQFFQKNVPCVALFLWASSSFIRTMSPTARFRCSLFHFVRTWRFWIYPRLHLVQNWPARNCNFLHLCRT